MASETGAGQASWIQLPALPPFVAHSFVESAGYPCATPSTAFAACWLVAALSDDAVTPDCPARFSGTSGASVTVTVT